MKIIDLPMVYVLTTDDFKYTKIGTTVNLKSRMRNIQSGCPFKLRLHIKAHTDRAVALERILHHKFKESRLCGEWFSLSIPDFDQLCLLIDQENYSIKAKLRGVKNEVV